VWSWPWRPRSALPLRSFPPGGSFDLIARDLSTKLAALWGQAVVIDNRAGAGGNIGAQAVIAAPADGYTLLFWGDGVLANPLLYPSAPFDAIRDLAGVALVATAPQVLVSHAEKGPRSIKEMLSAKQVLNYGTAGNGTPGHLAAELLKREGAQQLNHIPYKGGSPALTDLMGGQIQLVSTGLPACITLIRSGRIHAVAITSTARLKTLPDVPTVGETIAGYEVDTWFGFMAPKATPDEVRIKLADDVRKVMADPALQKKLVDGGFVPAISTPAELDEKMVKDLAFWRVQVSKSGARAE
jgi:tripartite-type tricarboxylate transporter receptor subunit TctC